MKTLVAITALCCGLAWLGWTQGSSSAWRPVFYDGTNLATRSGLGTNIINISGGGTNDIVGNLAHLSTNQATANGWGWTPYGAGVAITAYDHTLGGVNVTIPDTIGGLSVLTFGESVFKENTNIVAVSGGNNCAEGWSDSAFSECSSLVSVTLDMSADVSTFSFWKCAALATVSVQDVETIGDYAFSVNSNLTAIYYGDAVPTIGADVFLYSPNVTNYYPAGATNWLALSPQTLGGRPAVMVDTHATTLSSLALGRKTLDEIWANSGGGTFTNLFAGAGTTGSVHAASAITNHFPMSKAGSLDWIEAISVDEDGGWTTDADTLDGRTRAQIEEPLWRNVMYSDFRLAVLEAHTASRYSLGLLRDLYASASIGVDAGLTTAQYNSDLNAWQNTAGELWSPAEIADQLTAWYDYSDASTVTEGEVLGSNRALEIENKISGMPDLIGDDGTQPLYTTNFNGRNVASFPTGATLRATTGSTNWHSTTGFSSFAICKYTNPAGESGWLANTHWSSDSTYGSGFLMSASGANLGKGEAFAHRGATLYRSISTNTIPVDTFFLQQGNVSVGNYINTGINAIFTTSTTISADYIENPAKPIKVGRYNAAPSGTYFHGQLGELIVGNLLSTNDRQKVEGYLAHKWGTTAGLPSDHPYKSTFIGDPLLPVVDIQVISESHTVSNTVNTVQVFGIHEWDAAYSNVVLNTDLAFYVGESTSAWQQVTLEDMGGYGSGLGTTARMYGGRTNLATAVTNTLLYKWHLYNTNVLHRLYGTGLLLQKLPEE